MRRLILTALAFAITAPATAQTPQSTTSQPSPAQPAPAYEARAKGLLGILAGSGDYDAFFTPGFRTAVPKDKFQQVNVQLAAANGAPVAIVAILPDAPWSGMVHIRFEKGVMAFQMTVDPADPHQVSGLRVKGVVAQEKSIDEVAATLGKLPGATGFAFAKLGTGAPQLTLQHNAEKALAVGSAFKLVILAELVRETNAGRRKWDDLVTLDGRQLPGGGYTAKPAGTQVSLRELATQMISISDNSATDILLHHLGRARVEAMLRVTGIADPKGMTPFPSTLEIFKLKGIPGLAERYLARDANGRRLMLDGEVATAPITAISPTLFRDGKPVLIEQLEWFATPADMVRVMDWIRRNTDGDRGVEARKILGINTGIAPPIAARWKSVGYKGGSEPGVIHMTLLLEGKDGSWYVLTGSWNNPAAAVDDGRFAGLISKAAELAAP